MALATKNMNWVFWEVTPCNSVNK